VGKPTFILGAYLEKENLAVLLLRLAKLTGETAKTMTKTGAIRKLQVPYLKQKVTKLEYKEGVSSFGSIYEQEIKEEWDWVAVYDYVEGEVKKTEDFSRLAHQVSSAFGTNVGQAEFWISRFLNTISLATLNGANEERIFALTYSFMKDLEGSPKSWTPRIWIKGTWLVEDTLNLPNGITLRKPTAADLENSWSLQLFPYFMGSLSIDHPTAILEMSIRAKDQPEVSREIQKLILMLRLWKVGSVESIRTYWISESILQFGGYHSRSGVQETFKYPLSKADIPKLGRFIEVVSTLVPKKLFEPTTEQVDYSMIAIQRYNDAVMKPEIMESRLSLAIMALESLYLKEKEREELEHRLSQRISRLLGLYGYEPLEVFNTMKQSYSIRSSYVHGSPILDERLGEVSKLVGMVTEYTRHSIIVFLQLKPKIEKDNLLSLIDNSLLSDKALDKLKGILKENCPIYNDLLKPDA